MLLRLGLVPVLLAACATDSSTPVLGKTERALLGCWEGQQGVKTVQLQFHPSREVDTRQIEGPWYRGTFFAEGNELTYDFGEEPPTYQIEVTATTLRYLDPPFTFARIDCPPR